MSVDFWRSYQMMLDPWGADYDLPVQLDGNANDTREAVQVGVEPGPWAARLPEPGRRLPARLVFIDGRRRLDARVIGRLEDAPLYGAFATLGVGAVVVDRATQRTWCEGFSVRRVTAVGANRDVPETQIGCPFGGAQVIAYEPALTGRENTPQTPMTLVQDEMLREEARVAGRVAQDDDVMVVRDGPLRWYGPDSVVGYVKTIHQRYLPAQQAALLWTLRPGERTPLFLIGAPGSSSHRWSWYMRTARLERTHGLSGIVRLEVSGLVPPERARELADQTTTLIPTYASQPHRDPRAPQNLTPVGGLEREIGRRMGDPRVIQRRLAHFLAANGATP